MQVSDIKFSSLDKSVNFVFKNQLESRYVRRDDDKLLIYLSSQNGCAKACRFCHLTQTGQTTQMPADRNMYVHQAYRVLDYYDNQCRNQVRKAKRANFNFMARGEPLANPYMRNIPEYIFETLQEMTAKRGLPSKMNISTIMPFEVYDNDFAAIYGRIKVPHQIFYSLYSVKEEFRKRWLPKAMEYQAALMQLKKWQDRTGNTLVFHHAFIEGENDSVEDVEAFLEAIRSFEFQAKFNCVRYNPFSDKQGKESSEEVIKRNFDMIASEMTLPGSRIVPRVGFDVAASCGMFLDLKKE